MNSIEFWYSIGSTYSYLTVMRINDVAHSAGTKVIWRPFDVRAIMIEQKNIPFTNKPVKSAYMWRDIERRAEMYGLPVSLPAPYPLQELVLANRVAFVGQTEGWVEDYTIESYRLWFVDGLPAGSEPNLSKSLKSVGQDPIRVLDLANSAEVADGLTAQTEECKELGVFGAPSFVVGSEVFWGDDRLEDALKWSSSGSLKPSQKPT